ncbi:MAG TPA: RnfH family protein [Rhodanobacteraceae bacterium]|nr:RnfH family protein [Rhodanobacteraceae bacterium]
MPRDTIHVEVAYAEPDRQFLRRIELPAAATVEQALVASGIESAFGIALAGLTVGVWSRPVSWQTPLHDGDRVELYRDLEIDPKEARRRRASAGHPPRERQG